MSRWLISVPVWGEQYCDVFVRAAAPALLHAAHRLDHYLRGTLPSFLPGVVPVRVPQIEFLLHTQGSGDRLVRALPGFPVEVRPIPNKPTYVALQEGHADALRSAEPGDRVVLLNADIVVSGDLLLRCAQHIESGKQAVVLMGIRTTRGPVPPPAGAPSRELLEWAWLHRHQIIRDLEWPAGGSMLPTNLFWSTRQSTVARGFHLHPVAVVKHDKIVLKSTIDGDLLDYFPRDGIHVVTDPDDCSMCEVSPPEKRFPVRGTHFTLDQVVNAMQYRASATHRWLFEHRIVVRGSGADIATDCDFAPMVLSRLENSTFGGGPKPAAAGREARVRTRLMERGRVPHGRRGVPRKIVRPR